MFCFFVQIIFLCSLITPLPSHLPFPLFMSWHSSLHINQESLFNRIKKMSQGFSQSFTLQVDWKPILHSVFRKIKFQPETTLPCTLKWNFKSVSVIHGISFHKNLSFRFHVILWYLCDSKQIIKIPQKLYSTIHLFL